MESFFTKKSTSNSPSRQINPYRPHLELLRKKKPKISRSNIVSTNYIHGRLKTERPVSEIHIVSRFRNTRLPMPPNATTTRLHRNVALHASNDDFPAALSRGRAIRVARRQFGRVKFSFASVSRRPLPYAFRLFFPVLFSFFFFFLSVVWSVPVSSVPRNGRNSFTSVIRVASSHCNWRAVKATANSIAAEIQFEIVLDHRSRNYVKLNEYNSVDASA